MRTNLFLAAAVLAIANVASPVHAVSVLDQSNLLCPPGSCANWTFNGALNWEQGVTAGLTGQLTGVQLFLYQAPPSQAFSLEVRIAMGTPFHLTSTFLFDQFTSPTGFLDTSAAGIFMTAGDQFVIDTSNSSPPGGYGSDHGFNGPGSIAYPGGRLWYAAGPPFGNIQSPDNTMAFQTFVDVGAAPNVVPLPTTWLMLLSGFVGLGFFAYRGTKKRTAALTAA